MELSELSKLPEEEKVEIAKEILNNINTYFLEHEKETFYKYLHLSGQTDVEFLIQGLGFLYQNNNQVEIDILTLSPFSEKISKSITPENAYILKDFFEITPSIVSIYAEIIRKTGTLYDLLELYNIYLKLFTRVIDRFPPIGINEEVNEVINKINSWSERIKERIKSVKEEISFQKELELLSKNELKTEKSTPILEWKGHDNELNRLSRKLYQEKLTNKPTSFERVFTENKPTEWKGSIHCLAYFLYSLKNSFENNPKIIASDGTGYMKTALFYFTDCESKLLSNQKHDLSDLAYKVKNTKSKHIDTKRLIDKIIKETFQPR